MERSTTSLLALEVAEHVLELAGDEVLDLLGELGDLLCKLVTLGTIFLPAPLTFSSMVGRRVAS